MSWIQILSDAGLSEREANAVIILSTSPNMKASELAKELGTTRLDAYNSLERLQQIGLVTSTADRPMRFSSPSITDVVKHLVEIRREQLSRIEEGFKRMDSGEKSGKDSAENKASIDEPKFAVLKERVHILKRIEKMADEAEESLVLVLGKFGILHLCRSSALSEINSAAKKGVVVRVLGQLDKRTIRFYNELDSSIEIRHSVDLDAQGAVIASSDVIQYHKT